VPLTEAAARCEEGGFVWLGLLEPAEDELATDFYRAVHPLLAVVTAIERTGLDQYQVRRYDAWYRRITLACGPR